ncbi:uncharacterized protein METZ01_LOCUS60595 [marine metagenome]|uniref:Uncharacterized protein n=1 Tax=marine metagenome TaxID=408172 RepID=A0A381SWQ5_9ZZZZ
MTLKELDWQWIKLAGQFTCRTEGVGPL